MRAIDPDSARRVGLTSVGLFWLITIGWMVLRDSDDANQTKTIEVVHWANGHMAGDEALLPSFAASFNAAGFRSSSGSRIVARPYIVNSGTIRQELVSRVRGIGPVSRNLPDPVLVSPVASHWLYAINDAVGREVVATDDAQSIASTWIGIATFKSMAECLGWPSQDLGYVDIIALSADPLGWGSRPCARAEWGRRPLIAYTDPNSSSTGRSVLFTMFSIATGKPPAELTADDIAGERATAYLRSFQAQVDHYVPDTLLLNCEIFGGPTYGHFFPVAEDNLVKLHKGIIVQTDPALERLFPCRRTAGDPIENDMVMIYPREGATEHTHPAAAVRADWVTEEQREAALRWIAFIREDPRQRILVDRGFRPSTRLAVGCPICPSFGLQPTGPRVRIDPSRIPPRVGEQAVAAWGDVKNTGAVIFVVDTSLAMAGDKLQSTRESVIKAIDQMYDRNIVGLVTYSGSVQRAVAAAPLTTSRFQVTDALRRSQVSGGSDLFGAISAAVEMAAAAPVSGRAIRGVVVLAGGGATTGRHLDDLVMMASHDGKEIATCRGFVGDTQCIDEVGRSVDRTNVRGLRLIADGGRSIKVYFIGIGMDESELNVGRILAEATGSQLAGATSENLATVVGVFKGYF
ncbi:MAG: VWA domain-containing protein [Chloroflexota bacterium]|nr:MAG: VWA domain-containing protein [Chloroflexota bacterium]